MQSCSGQIFYLPVSIECFPFSFVFLCPPPSFDKMTERVINHWKPPVATRPHPLALTSTHTYTFTQKKTQIHHSCFMAQFPWQELQGLGWKTVIPVHLWEHLDSEGHLRAKGRSRAGGWKRKIWVSWNAQGEKWRNVLMIIWKIGQYLLYKCGVGGGVAPEAIIPPSVLALSITKEFNTAI